MIIHKLAEKVKGEEGAVALVEASYLYPIAFLLVIFFLSLSFLLWRGGYESLKSIEDTQQPTNSPYFQDPGAIPCIKGKEASLKVSGLFLKKLQLQASEDARRGLSFRYFKVGEKKKIESHTRFNWSSPANNLWKYLAIQAWIKNGKQRSVEQYD